MKPKSPTRLVTNAFLPATAAELRSNQNETSRYEQRPTPSQPEEGDEEARAEHEHQHRGGEQVQVREEPREARVAVHVPDRVEVDQRADAGDEQDHRRPRAGRRGSRSRRGSVPAWIHVKSVRDVRPRVGAAASSSAKNVTTDHDERERRSVAVAIQPAIGSPMRLPNSSSTTAPNAGSAGISQTRSRRSRRAHVDQPFSRSTSSAVDAVAAPEDRHDDRETDRDLGGRDDQREEHDHLAADVVERLGERDEREVRRVEHQLDAHEHHERVAADEQPDRADREEHRREREVVGRA